MHLWLLIPLSLCGMAWFRSQFHHRTVYKVIQPIMREECLSLRDLDFIRATLPDALVVRRNGVLQRLRLCLYGLESLNEAVRGVECIVCALAAI